MKIAGIFTGLKKITFHLLSKIKVRTRLIIFFIILSIIPLSIIGYFSYNSFESTLEEKVGFYSHEIIKQLTLTINSTIKKTEKLSFILISNRDLMEIISKEKYEDSFDELLDIQTVENEITSIANSNQEILDILIYRPGKKTFKVQSGDVIEEYLGKDFSKSEYYQKAMNKKGKPIWVTGLNNNYDRILLMRSLNNSFTNKALGVLILVLRTDAINFVSEDLNLGKNARLFLSNEDNHYIFHTDEKLIGTGVNSSFINTIDGSPDTANQNYFHKDNQLITFGECLNGWKAVGIIPFSSLMNSIYIIGRNIIFITLILIIISIIISLIIASSISQPLYSIINLMKRVEKGDLTTTASIDGKDELADLADSFNIMVSNIKQLINNALSTNQNVQNHSLKVSDIAGQTAASSQQISASITTISEGANYQADEAQKSVELMNKLDGNIEKVNKNINKMISISENIRDTSNNASITVNKLKENTEKTSQVSRTIRQDINNLNKKVNEISNIINLIEEISEQTNLLSLNASIEAARAGQAGRGFSVVAEEIRKLAQDSSKATEMIATIIRQITSETEKTVQEVEKAEETYKEQRNSVTETDHAFSAIMNSLEDIIKQINNVNSAVQSINTYKKNAIEDIENMASIAQESAATTEEVTAVSQEQASSAEQLTLLSEALNDTIKDLNKSITKFKVS